MRINTDYTLIRCVTLALHYSHRINTNVAYRPNSVRTCRPILTGFDRSRIGNIGPQADAGRKVQGGCSTKAQQRTTGIGGNTNLLRGFEHKENILISLILNFLLARANNQVIFRHKTVRITSQMCKSRA
jgi:hypothetical protein